MGERRKPNVSGPGGSFLSGLRVAGIALLGAAVLISAGCATAPKGKAGSAKPETVSIEERWGVKIESIRTSAAGNLVDFRYRVLDPEKALPLVDRTKKPYLIDQATGAALVVPDTAKVGPLRATEKFGNPKEGRVYFVLFGNPGGFVKPGNRVTVVIGEFRAEDLVVE